MLPAYSSCSLHKQLSAELGQTLSNQPGSVWPPKPASSCELMDKEKCCRLNSSAVSLHDVNGGSMLMNNASDSSPSRRPDKHSQNCYVISDENSSLKPSFDSPTKLATSQLYVSVQLSVLNSKIYSLCCTLLCHQVNSTFISTIYCTV